MRAASDGAPDARYPGLAGKRVVITGGASGIGRCLLQAFLDQSSLVTVVDRDEAALAECASRFGGGVRLIAADLSLPDRAQAAIVEAAGTEGIDVLIANAGNDTRHAWDAVTAALWRQTLAINLDHPFFCAQAAAHGMVARRQGGCIILVGSIAARRGRPAMVGYLSAKAAIEGMTRGLARELGPHGIRVAGIVPGAIETERQRRLWRTPDMGRAILAEQAMPVLLDGWDVAAMALFLASPGARGCTGQLYTLDAGLS